VSAWRSSKAKDTYGPIVELVKKQQEIAKKTGLPTNYPGGPLALTNKSGIFPHFLRVQNIKFILDLYF
jgi:hypothetical protein